MIEKDQAEVLVGLLNEPAYVSSPSGYAGPHVVALRDAVGASVCIDDDCGLSGSRAHVGPCEPCGCPKHEHAAAECAAIRADDDAATKQITIQTAYLRKLQTPDREGFWIAVFTIGKEERPWHALIYCVERHARAGLIITDAFSGGWTRIPDITCDYWYGPVPFPSKA